MAADYTLDQYKQAYQDNWGTQPTAADINNYNNAGQTGGAPASFSDLNNVMQANKPAAAPVDPAVAAKAANDKVTADTLAQKKAADAVTPGTYNAQGTMALLSQNATNPTLTAGETLTAQHVDPNAAGTAINNNVHLAPESPLQAAQATASHATAAQATAGQATAAPKPGTATYDANLIGSMTPQMIAAQGQVDPRSLTQNQYNQLMNFPPDQIPDWAKGAVRTAQESLASHGLGASTMAGEAITSALMSAALPIAQQDAKTFETMNLKNLDNQQQALIVNTQARVQTMMSDQSASNAAQQFNAQSVNQMNQFYSQLVTDVSKFNAAQLTAVSQSNAALSTSVSQSNASLDTQASISNAAQTNAIAQFNQTMSNNRDQFNSANQLVIDQSNATWRRNVNTANTAADNAANATNAQNTFNLSQTSLNNIWQKYRDDASYAFQTGENDKNRAATLAMMNLSWDHQSDAAFSNALGSAAFGFVKPVTNAIINSLTPVKQTPIGTVDVPKAETPIISDTPIGGLD